MLTSGMIYYESMNKLTCILLCAVIVTACERPPPQNARGYMGSESCQQCHADIYQKWRQSHHFAAMQEATPDTVLGNFDNQIFVYNGIKSEFYRRKEGYFVRTDGDDGELAEFQVHYTFGVYPLQQYLIVQDGGRYQALSIAWDSRRRKDGGQRWFHLYPDDKITHHSALHWTRHAQNWNTNCAECHSTGVEKNYDVKSHSYRTTWTDINVGCEACHGPGQQHIQWAQGDGYRTPHKGLLPQMTAQKQLADEPSRCATCHSLRMAWGWETDVAFDAQNELQPIAPPHYFADGQIHEEVYVYGSFLQSAMHSAGVKCSDCHDPHTAQVKETNNALCVQCHDADAYATARHHHHNLNSAGAVCVSCHSPARTYMQIDDRRDHQFSVPRPDLSATLETPSACAQCHDRQQWVVENFKRWYPQRAAQGHYAVPLHRIRTAGATSSTIAAVRHFITQPHTNPIIRSSLLSVLPVNWSSVTPDLISAVQSDSAWSRIGAMRQLGLHTQYLPLFIALLRDDNITVRLMASKYLALLSDEQQQQLSNEDRTLWDTAMADFVSLHRQHSDSVRANLTLGEFYVWRKDLFQAEETYKQALRIERHTLTALLNLADVYRQQKREKEGLSLLNEAITIFPHAGSAHYALALWYVRAGQARKALGKLRRATQLQPEEPQYALVYAVALFDHGRHNQAIEVLATALKRHRYNLNLLHTAINYLEHLRLYDSALKYVDDLRQATPLRAQIDGIENRIRYKMSAERFQ